jgi:hypothetical protein
MGDKNSMESKYAGRDKDWLPKKCRKEMELLRFLLKHV